MPQRASQRAWYERNRERILARRRAYYAANREAILAQERMARQAQPRRLGPRRRPGAAPRPEAERLERRRQADRRKRQKGRERRAAYDREWRERNPERAAELNRRSARARRLDRDRLSVEYAEVLLADPCSYCGVARADTIDHIEPLAGGGRNAWENLTAACRACNSRKHTYPLLVFLLVG